MGKLAGIVNMKKQDIWISIAIIAGAILLSFSFIRATGQIEIDAGGASAVMRLRRSFFRGVTISTGKKPATVNAQVYRPSRLRISKQQDGRTWKIDSRGPWGNLSKISVNKNKTTNLRLGPPLLTKSSVSRLGTRISIGLTIIGQAGEHYLPTSTGSAPKIKIIDEAGNVLASGRFEYG